MVGHTDQQAPAGAQHAPGRGEKTLRFGHMLDGFEADYHVQAVVGEEAQVLKIAGVILQGLDTDGEIVPGIGDGAFVVVQPDDAPRRREAAEHVGTVAETAAGVEHHIVASHPVGGQGVARDRGIGGAPWLAQGIDEAIVGRAPDSRWVTPRRVRGHLL